MSHPPRPTVEWVLTIDEPFTDDQADALFHTLREHGHTFTLYGKGPHGWTYAKAADAEGPFQPMTVLTRLVGIMGETVKQEQFEALLQTVRDAGHVPTVSCSPEQAADRSYRLAALKRSMAPVEVELEPEERFDREALHKALVARGLQPTDGPMYEPDGQPDSYVVEVYDDIVRLYLDVARTKDPEATFEALLRTANALWRRFPCVLRTHGLGLDELREVVAERTARLREAGFEPGSDEALFLF